MFDVYCSRLRSAHATLSKLFCILSQDTTTDTAWFVLAREQPLQEGEALNAQSWGYVDGANVAPMWGSVSHAALAES